MGHMMVDIAPLFIAVLVLITAFANAFYALMGHSFVMEHSATDTANYHGDEFSSLGGTWVTLGLMSIGALRSSLIWELLLHEVDSPVVPITLFLLFTVLLVVILLKMVVVLMVGTHRRVMTLSETDSDTSPAFSRIQAVLEDERLAGLETASTDFPRWLHFLVRKSGEDTVERFCNST